MVFTVTGELADGNGYTVTVGDQPADLPDQDGHPEVLTSGVVAGDAPVVTLLEVYAGEEVLASPTGPAYTLDLSDPRTVLAGLQHLTHVDDVTGEDIPETVPPVDPNVVY